MGVRERINVVCDVCGEPATHVVRYGGRQAAAESITGPNLYGCNNHLLGGVRDLENSPTGWITANPNIQTEEIEVLLWD